MQLVLIVQNPGLCDFSHLHRVTHFQSHQYQCYDLEVHQRQDQHHSYLDPQDLSPALSPRILVVTLLRQLGIGKV